MIKRENECENYQENGLIIIVNKLIDIRLA